MWYAFWLAISVMVVNGGIPSICKTYPLPGFTIKLYDDQNISTIGTKCIIVTANNITIDGRGHQISCTASSCDVGIKFENVSYATIKNIKLSGFTTAIRLNDVTYYTITNSSVTNGRLPMNDTKVTTPFCSPGGSYIYCVSGMNLYNSKHGYVDDVTIALSASYNYEPAVYLVGSNVTLNNVRVLTAESGFSVRAIRSYSSSDIRFYNTYVGPIVASNNTVLCGFNSIISMQNNTNIKFVNTTLIGLDIRFGAKQTYGVHMSSCSNISMINTSLGYLNARPSPRYNDQNITGPAYGLYIDSTCTNVNIDTFFISNITAPNGFACTSSCSAVLSDPGFAAYGVYTAANYTTITNLHVVNVIAGAGGVSGKACSDGGAAYGVYLESSAIGSIIANVKLKNVVGGGGGGVSSNCSVKSNPGKAYYMQINQFLSQMYLISIDPNYVPAYTVLYSTSPLSKCSPSRLAQSGDYVCYPPGPCCSSNCSLYDPNTQLCRTNASACDAPEYCTRANTQCPNNLFYGSSHVCRNSTDLCDPAEMCNGSSPACPADKAFPNSFECRPKNGSCDVAEFCYAGKCPINSVVTNTSVVCRNATNVCDVAETCDGKNIACPPNKFLSQNTLCRLSVDACDRDDFCTGVSDACIDQFYDSSKVCRPINGTCDLPEVCNGSAACPDDQFKSSAFLCRNSTASCDAPEYCAGSRFCPINTVYPNYHPCRPAIGECDMVEYCNGQSMECGRDDFFPKGHLCGDTPDSCADGGFCSGQNSSCPSGLKNSSNLCRPKEGPCDIEEFCTGFSEMCPIDVFLNSSTICRSQAGGCDAAETCNGLDANCPDDLLRPLNYTCRSSEDLCDHEEVCNGSSIACPDDIIKSTSYVCRAATDSCDAAELCNGTSIACPVDIYWNASHVCRPALGECDAEELCSGYDVTCPNDTLHDNTTICRSSIGECDPDETCTGFDLTCPDDVLLELDAVCRPVIGDCDIAEVCSGTDPKCPPDLVLPKEMTCRDAQSDCDAPAACNGSSALCPANAVFNASTACRVTAGLCDVTEFCDGMSADCPADLLLNETYVCRPSEGECVWGQTCTGQDIDCPIEDLFKDNSTLCRPSSAICDVEEYCTGTSGRCPMDLVKDETVVCSPPSDCSLLSKCDGALKTCPASAHVANETMCHLTCAADAHCVSGACVATTAAIYCSYGASACDTSDEMCKCSNASLRYPYCADSCGNGICDNNESCVTCAVDCDSPCNACGDSVCEGDETCSSCFTDCGTCARGCAPSCGPHGTCRDVCGPDDVTCHNNDVTCHCDIGWSGEDCSSPMQTITMKIRDDATLYSIISSAGPDLEVTSFQISILEFQELGLNDVIIQNASLDSVRFQLIGNSSESWNYTAILGNGARVRFTFWIFQNETTVNFAGRLFTYGPNMLKFAIAIDYWPFQRVSNRFAIVSRVDPVVDASPSASACVTQGADYTNNIQWLKVNFKGKQLFAQFIDLVVVDARVVSVATRSLGGAAVRTIVPHFWETCYIDPNYAMLLGSSSQGEDCSSLVDSKKRRISTGAITGIVCGIIGFAVVVAATVTLYKKCTRAQRMRSFTKRMAEMSNVAL